MSTCGNLRFGKSIGTSRCSVLVVCLDDSFREFVNLIIEKNRDLHNNTFHINICGLISNVLMNSDDCCIDYIVICVNACRLNWIDVVEQNIALMDKAYLCGRFCLVINTQSVGNGLADLSSVDVLKQKYSMCTIFGELNRKGMVDVLAERTLHLVKLVCCNPNGLPISPEFPKIL